MGWDGWGDEGRDGVGRGKGRGTEGRVSGRVWYGRAGQGRVE